MKKLLTGLVALGLASAASADSITFTGNGGSSNFGNSVGFTSNGGGISGNLTATDENGNTSGVSGFTLDGYGVSAGGYRSIQGDETLTITFDVHVDINQVHLRQWEGPDNMFFTANLYDGSTSTVSHNPDNGGVFNTNEYVNMNLVGVKSLEVTGIYNGTTLFIPNTQFFVAGISDIEVSAVPLPAAAWLFGSALLGLVGVARRKRA